MYYIDKHPILKDQLAVFASEDIAKNIVVFDLSKLPTMNVNTRFAITLKKGEYIDTTESDGKLVNHSCDPNLSFNIASRKFITLKNIKKNDMFTFDYLTTEPEMVEPFNCICGSSKCTGFINGSFNKSST